MRANLRLNLVVLSICMISPLSAQHQPSNSAETEVLHISSLRGVVRENALRALLIRLQSEPAAVRESILYYEGRIRPDLRALVRDSDVGREAADWLSLIGVPDDLRFILQSPPPGISTVLPNRWAYGVACSLFEPSTEEEWEFLRKCAMNGYDDRWVDFGAIETLKLIASPRSRTILEEAQAGNQFHAEAIGRALAYIRSEPAPLQGPGLSEVVTRVGSAIRFGDWEATGRPRKNEAGDKAFVDYRFFTGEDVLTYTAAFHNVHGIWTLRGVRETMQEFASPRIEIPRPLPPMLPPPEVQPPVQR